MAKKEKAVAITEPYKPKPTMCLEKDDIVKGLKVGGKVKLVVDAKLVGENISEYDDDNQHTQRFEIIGVTKPDKITEQNSKLQE